MATSARHISDRSALEGWNGVCHRAAAACTERGTDLTPLREAVLAELWEAGAPLGAYELSTRLSDRSGHRIAANSVYRILQLLQSVALIRRVESKHAYYIVKADADADDILLLCSDCGGITSIGTGDIKNAIATLSEKAGFHATRQVVEVAGRCSDCNAEVRHD